MKMLKNEIMKEFQQNNKRVNDKKWKGKRQN